MNMNISPQILKDSELLAELELSQLRLLKDGDLDWFILIPRKSNIIEWNDLAADELALLNQEITSICSLIKNNLEVDKINVANLGNLVPQFHVHIIARYKTDRAWPGPIWGTKTLSEFNMERVEFWQSKGNW